MSQAQWHVVVRHIRRLAGQGGAGPTDRELLQRFSAARDEAAFAALVERHGPLVWGVCRRALRHQQDAEDAFQATFLVLARKAAAVDWRESVHNWLYEVASRLAAEARTKAARRRRHEGLAAGRARAEVLPEDAGRELAAILDEELHRLPARYRTPLLLCYLDGQTTDQAARHLGWSLRTLQRRLAQGRDLLRCRLTRRGLTLSAVLLAPALAEGGAVPAWLTTTTLRAALSFTAGAAGCAPEVTALAEGLLRGMAMTRIKIAAVVLVVLGTLAGTGALVRHTFASPFAPPASDGARPPAKEAPAPGKAADEAREATPTAFAIAFAPRLWATMDLVQEKHPMPPPRADMVLAVAKSLYKAAKATPPDDLDRRAARVKTREQFAAFLEAVWPQGADASPAGGLGEAVMTGLFSVVPGQGEFVPADLIRITEQINGNRYIGTGIQIRMHEQEKVPQIITPFRGSPAHRAGLKPDDLIVEVEGKSTRGVPLMKVVDWLRGDEGTTAVIKVRAPAESEARTVKMTRSVVPFDTVFGYRRASEDAWEFRIDPRGPVGYVRLESFRGSTAHELRQVERRLRDDGVRALVIDLRTSGGGSDLHNGTLVAGALCDGGLMWTVRGADKQAREYRAGREGLFRDWPLVVLINNGLDQSQAGVAAALRDNGRAVLVGEATRNGGFIRSTLPLPDEQGAVAIWTGRMERAAKDRGWPLEPDHAVPLTKAQREAVDTWLRDKGRVVQPGGAADRPPQDPQLDKAVEVLRAALKKSNEAR
jgi:C-terminal peptidase prc